MATYTRTTTPGGGTAIYQTESPDLGDTVDPTLANVTDPSQQVYSDARAYAQANAGITARLGTTGFPFVTSLPGYVDPTVAAASALMAKILSPAPIGGAPGGDTRVSLPSRRPQKSANP